MKSLKIKNIINKIFQKGYISLFDIIVFNHFLINKF